MQKKLKHIYQQPDIHFTICSSNKELFAKFDRTLQKHGLVGLPDLQGNLHYIVDGRKGFPTAYKNVQSTALRLMEKQTEEQTEKTNKCKDISDYLINKYSFDKSLIGTKFISYMILYCLLDKSLLLSFSKNLYPTIAEIFDSNPEKICYSARYSLRKLEKLENQQRANYVEREYLLEANKSYSNRSAIYRLINEGETMLEEGQEKLGH